MRKRGIHIVCSSVISNDLLTFTQHGPSMTESSQSKQPAGNSLALTTAGTEPAGMNESKSSKSFTTLPKRIERDPSV